MEFEIIYSTNHDTRLAAQEISSKCYREFQNASIIDCKIFNVLEISDEGQIAPRKRQAIKETAMLVTAVARFEGAISTAQKNTLIQNLQTRINETENVASVTQVSDRIIWQIVKAKMFN